MNGDQLRKLQLTQLEMLKSFREICDRHNLNYFLDGGTLLGAVRHKGFIPWDDDLDVGMPRSDYEKLCEIANAELPEGLFLQTYYSDPNYPNAFAKLRKNGTKFVELINESSTMRGGIYIDILPFDNYPDQKSKRMLQGVQIEFCKHVLLVKHKVYPWKGMKGKKRFLKCIEYAVFIPVSPLFSHRWLTDHYDRALRKYNGENTAKIKEPDLRYGRVVVPRECGLDFEMLDFEGEKFLCPRNYDAFLRELYGNYMELPPVEERGGWHGVKEVGF